MREQRRRRRVAASRGTRARLSFGGGRDGAHVRRGRGAHRVVAGGGVQQNSQVAFERRRATQILREPTPHRAGGRRVRAARGVVQPPLELGVKVEVRGGEPGVRRARRERGERAPPERAHVVVALAHHRVQRVGQAGLVRHAAAEDGAGGVVRGGGRETARAGDARGRDAREAASHARGVRGRGHHRKRRLRATRSESRGC